jgi:fructose-1,6-bisphosphatase/inositol monophosphatase family enzyme
MTQDDVQALTQILRDAAAREIMPRFRHLGAHDIRAKTGPNDLVTEADEAAERMITRALRTRFPGCLVVGEEAVAADPRLLARLEGAALAFVVDPVDGTYNFQAGVPLFGVMAAAIEHGAVTGGVILDPVVDDAFMAVAGQGAWAQTGREGRRPLAVAPPVPLASMLGTASWLYLSEPARSRVMRGLVETGASWSYRCAAHEYRLAAAGYCHYLQYGRLYPWDHAPGSLIHREAGGFSARFDGTPYRPTETEGGLICAPDRASWQLLRNALLGPLI